MFEKVKDKLSNFFGIQRKINYQFNYTSYENLTNENLTRMFYCETFGNIIQAEQAKIVQEHLNRLTKEFGLRTPLNVVITTQTNNDVDLAGNNININPNALWRPVMLYTQLAAIAKRAQQVEFAMRNPNSPIGIQLNNPTIGVMTGFTYDHARINPINGVGSLYFNPTHATILKYNDTIDYNDQRLADKTFSPDYYISRLQPTERDVSLVMEKALGEMRERLREDKQLDSFSMKWVQYVDTVIGRYNEDKYEYIARTGVQNIEEEIDRYIVTMGKNPNAQFVGSTDVVDADIKLAAMHAYNKQHEIPLRLSDDPRIGQQNNFTLFDFAQMNDADFKRCFYPDNWKTFSLEEKKMVLQTQCDREAKALGLKRSYTVSFENMHDGSNAFFRVGECKVHFNLTQLSVANPLTLYNTIPHELIHARQDEIAKGIIITTPEEQAFNVNWMRQTNITTPTQFHGQSTIPINGVNLASKRSSFVFMDNHEVINFSPRRVQESNNLYRLQPIEREAFEYQEQKNAELEAQLRADGKLDTQAQSIFNYEKSYSIAVIEKFVQETYGCPNPTEAIRQYQSYIKGLATTYDPQTSDFDFAMRFQILSAATYDQYKMYPIDPREEILEKDSITKDLDVPSQTPIWIIPGMAQGMLYEENQLMPIQYTFPLSDEVHLTERTLDMDVPIEIPTNEDGLNGNARKGEEHDLGSGNNDRSSEMLNDKDLLFILQQLGEIPEEQSVALEEISPIIKIPDLDEEEFEL